MCELCDLANGNIITRLYYQNDMVIVVDCATCHVPMLVFKHHGKATRDERRKARGVIATLFTYESLRTEPRKISDHEHYHILGAKYLGG